MKHKILLIAFTLVTLFACAFGLSACGEEEKQPSEGLEYTLSGDGTYYIVSGIGTCKDKDIVIPSTYNDLPVTEIGEGAFWDCTSPTSIVIPDSVTSIGSEAFAWCTSLKSITIPDSVTSIGSSAFYYCTSLTNVTISNGVTSIGEYAFSHCTSLKYDEYDNAYYLGNESNPYVVLVKAKSTDITSCTIDEKTKFIHSDAFTSCHSLTSIVIPVSVTSIGNEAFLGCTSLTSIVIPDSVTSIGEWAFSNCKSLTSVTVDGNNSYYKSIDGNLYSKDGATLIQYAIGKTDTSFTIPDSVTSIGDGAFLGCTSLTSIVIPDSVTSIGNYAFRDCTSLTSVNHKNRQRINLTKAAIQ